MKLQKIWKMRKVEVIPVVIGALGTVTKYFEKWIEKLDLDLTIEALQKPCILGMARIIRSVRYEMKIIIIAMIIIIIIIIIKIIPESNIKLARRKIYPPEGTATLLWNWPWYSTTGCHKLPWKFTIKSACINKLDAELKRMNMHGQFCKIPWPTSCRQRAIQPMAKTFYPKKIYRVNNSCHPKTDNLHQMH